MTSKRFWFINKMKFCLKMIIGCNSSMTVSLHMGIVVCGRSQRLTWNLLLFGITLSNEIGNDSEHGTWLRHISFMEWHIGFHDRIVCFDWNG